MPVTHGVAGSSPVQTASKKEASHIGRLFLYLYLMYYVYIIYSDHLDVYYKGFTMNPDERLKYHLEGGSEFTSRASDWKLVYSKAFETKKEALIEEKRLKKLNRSSIKRLLQG